MTSTTMRKRSRPLPVVAVIVIISLLVQPLAAFSVIANSGRKPAFQSASAAAVTSRTTTPNALTPLYMTFTMPIWFDAPSTDGSGAIWYESCVDPKARLPAYDEE